VVVILLFTQNHWGENWRIDTNPGYNCSKGIGAPLKGISQAFMGITLL
jgi:hypothetical protein